MNPKTILCLFIIILTTFYIILDVDFINSNIKKDCTKCKIKQKINIDESYIQKQKQGKIILYYADWCGACKRFMPEWNKLKTKYNNKIDFIQIEHKNIPEDIIKKLYGFPTVIWEDYNTGKKNEINKIYNIPNILNL